MVSKVFTDYRASALVPLSGGIIRHAEHFVDPALSFAQGWNNVYNAMISLPAEIVAAAVVVQFWSTVNSAVYITVFGLLLLVCNLLFVRVYGELEFTFASLKILLIVGLNIMVILSLQDTETRVDLKPGFGHSMWRRTRPSRIWLPILEEPWTLCRVSGLQRFFGEFHGLLHNILECCLCLLGH